MKAIHKQHQGFQHLSQYNQPVPHYEQTSTKKYPNNKYYQFDDEDSSGRKYLREELGLWEGARGQERRGYESLLEEGAYGDSGEGTRGSVRSRNGPTSKTCKTSVKSMIKSKTRAKPKKSALINNSLTTESYMRNINSSRHYKQESASEHELKYYKKLCVQMRKKNNQLTQQLNMSKENNRKSIQEIQKKVERMSERYVEKKQQADQSKNEKILQSLKAIKGKLNKKQTNQQKYMKKFYEFFVESLGILEPEPLEKPQKYSAMEVQAIWKQMLQFLVSHQYRLEKNTKARALR